MSACGEDPHGTIGLDSLPSPCPYVPHVVVKLISAVFAHAMPLCCYDDVRSIPGLSPKAKVLFGVLHEPNQSGDSYACLCAVVEWSTASCIVGPILMSTYEA